MLISRPATHARRPKETAPARGRAEAEVAVRERSAASRHDPDCRFAIRRLGGYRVYLLGFPRCKRSIISIPMGQTINSVVCHMLKALYSAAVWGCPCLPQYPLGHSRIGKSG